MHILFRSQLSHYHQRFYSNIFQHLTGCSVEHLLQHLSVPINPAAGRILTDMEEIIPSGDPTLRCLHRVPQKVTQRSRNMKMKMKTWKCLSLTKPDLKEVRSSPDVLVGTVTGALHETFRDFPCFCRHRVVF